MEERMIKFISALRSGGVRISLAESADAFRAVGLLGVQNRDDFRLSLRSTLVKDANRLQVFDELFPLFFDSGDAPDMQNLMDDMTPEEAEMWAEMMRQYNEQLRKMMEKLLRGEQLSQQELEQLAQLTGLNRTNDLKYQDWMMQRMMRALRFEEMQKAFKEMMELMKQMGMSKERLGQMRGLIQQNMKGMQEQLQQFAGQRIAENMANEKPEDALDNLMDKPFTALSDSDMDLLRKEMRRLANRLKSRIALRQKRAKTGQLDPKATIRSNLRYGGTPFEIKHRDHRLKPKLVVICDISTSMRYCAEMMLGLVYQLQGLVSKTHAFAFNDHLEFVSPDFSSSEANEAISQVLVRMPPGHYSTDLGYSLRQFDDKFRDTLDSRTTLIMVGDARNNYNDPRLDVFSDMARRARRTIWINPEPPMLWTSGDSDMLKYSPLCDNVVMAATLAELTQAVDHMLGEP